MKRSLVKHSLIKYRITLFALVFALLTCQARADSIFISPSPTGTAATGQIPGTTTNDSACTGCVGEFVSGAVGAGGALSISPSGTTINITSISLTAGDWDLRGQVGFNGGASTTVSLLAGGINTTTATLPGSNNSLSLPFTTGSAPFATAVYSVTTPSLRLSIAVTTTVFLTAQCTFAVSTCTAYGKIEARRAR